MDFLSLLSSSTSSSPKKPTQKPTSTNKDATQIYEHFQVGNRVKIQYVPNSKLNAYKGYIGEIKQYRKGQEHAIIWLHAINSQTFIKFPINHFTKI
jgi:hypothetical protein